MLSLRLKQAKEDAAAEVAAFRKTREEEMTMRLAQSVDSSGNLASALSERTDEEVEKLKALASQNERKTVDMLLSLVVAADSSA